jgi:hypothetical protein
MSHPSGRVTDNFEWCLKNFIFQVIAENLLPSLPTNRNSVPSPEIYNMGPFLGEYKLNLA